MTTLEITLIIVFYIFIAIITGTRFTKNLWKEAAFSGFILSVLWPITWIIRFIETFLLNKWNSW